MRGFTKNEIPAKWMPIHVTILELQNVIENMLAVGKSQKKDDATFFILFYRIFKRLATYYDLYLFGIVL